MSASDAAPNPTFMERMLNSIERVGNAMPSPAVLFVILCLGTIVLSQVVHWAGWQATYETITPPPAAATETYYGGSSEPSYVGPNEPQPKGEYKVHTETTRVQGLLSGDGVRFLFTSFVSNFRNFAALAIILVVMIGVGLAESAGLIGALIRKLVAISSASTLTAIIVFLGVLSSVASDAGYLVLIPLGAVAFRSVGRHPLAGMAAAFAGVAGGFGVNLMITPVDGVLTEITNEALGHSSVHHITLVSNLWFAIASAVLVTVVITLISAKVVEPRLGAYDPALAGEDPIDPSDEPEVSPEAESKGLRYAMWGALATVLVVALLTAIPGAPLRNPQTGEIIGDSPLMDSLILIIAAIFFVAGWCYGKGAGTVKDKDDVIAKITKSWSTLAGLLFLFLLIAQFIAYFNYSQIPDVAAVKLGDLLDHISIGAVWLLVGVILITTVVNMIIPQAIAKWALLAPVFVPLFVRLGVSPATVLAAYRVGDSPGNVMTPLMAYFPLVVIFAQRYDRSSGIGTLISLMLPYFVVLTVVWTVFFVAWYLIGIPMGPGYGIHV